jgi:L-alanine-DL-glutamate epimerase-like enolase superfamily enzyme
VTRPKPITPYARLLAAANRFESRVLYPKRKIMWFYPKSKLGESWALNDLAERVQAADQLGYDVRLVVDGNGNLSVEYVERPGSLNV